MRCNLTRNPGLTHGLQPQFCTATYAARPTFAVDNTPDVVEKLSLRFMTQNCSTKLEHPSNICRRLFIRYQIEKWEIFFTQPCVQQRDPSIKEITRNNRQKQATVKLL